MKNEVSKVTKNFSVVETVLLVATVSKNLKKSYDWKNFVSIRFYKMLIFDLPQVTMLWASTGKDCSVHTIETTTNGVNTTVQKERLVAGGMKKSMLIRLRIQTSCSLVPPFSSKPRNVWLVLSCESQRWQQQLYSRNQYILDWRWSFWIRMQH